MDIVTYGALNKKVGEKLSSNQGTQNAGKMLGINNEGEIQPIQVLGGNVSVTETLESGEDYSMVIEEGEPTAVTSVAGKYGTVTLDAGDIEYDEQEVYNSGTVGKEVGDLKSALYIQSTVTPTWNQGTVIKSTGLPDSASNRIYTDLIDYIGPIIVDPGADYKFAWRLYTSAGVFMGGSDFISSKTTLVFAVGQKCRILYAKSNDKSISPSDTIPITITANATKDQTIVDTQADIDCLKYDLNEYDNGRKPAAYTFIRGGLANQAVNQSYNYRIVNPDIIYPGKRITFHARTGYQYMLYTYNSDGTYSDNYGFRTSDTTINFGIKGYRICIAKTTETTSNPADIKEFSKGVYIDTSTSIDIASLRSSCEDINDKLLNYVSNNIRYEKGYLNADGSIHAASASNNEITSEYIAVTPDEKYLLTVEGKTGLWIAYIFYAADKTVVGSRSTKDSSTLLRPASNRLLTQEITVPSGAAYLRFSARTHGYTDYVRFNKIETSTGITIINSRIYDDVLNLRFKDYDEPNATFKSVNHRGYRENGAGENTIPAYQESSDNGFVYVETDVRFTADDVPVLLHNQTINATAYDSEGNSLANDDPIYLSDLTLDEVQEYKFGLGAYNCTIPTFDEFIYFCKCRNLHPYIELKESPVAPLYTIVQKYGMERNVTWVAFDVEYLSVIASLDHKARLGWLREATSENIATFTALRTYDQELFCNSAANLVTDAYCQLMQENNLPLEVYTVNDYTTAINLAKKSVIGATTDKMHLQYGMKYSVLS